MEISQCRVATIHYTLSDDNGQVLDRSTPDTPLSYLHGAGNIVPGLEQALEGKRLGDTLTADVVPEQGYGPRHEQLRCRAMRFRPMSTWYPACSSRRARSKARSWSR